MSDRPTCKTCQYWYDDPKECRDSENEMQECRRLPPNLPTESYQIGSMQIGLENGPFEGVWPLTKGRDWCGEHPGSVAWLAASQKQEPPA